MSRYYRHRGTDNALSLVIWLLLIIFLLPLAGLYFLIRKDPSQRGLGWALLIIGILLWVFLGA